MCCMCVRLLKWFVGSAATLLLGLFLICDGFFILPRAQHVEDPFADKPTQGVGVYYLNLDRAVARRQRLEPLVKAMAFPAYRVTGLDSKEVPDAAMPNYVDVKAFQRFYGRLPQKGEVLCTHSHLQALKMFLNSSYQYALILEDDADFNPEDMEKAVRELLLHGELWDICNLDIRDKGLKRFRLKLGKLSSGHEISVAHGIYGADAYVIKREAARKLLARALPLPLEIENLFSRAWELGYKYTCLTPLLVEQGDPSISRHLPYPVYQDSLLIKPVWWTKITHRMYRWKTGIMETLNAFRVYIQVLFV